eukprot:Skav229550  [mRNA]  locus=scaffold568:316865:328633:+ [translate_table: standard]
MKGIVCQLHYHGGGCLRPDGSSCDAAWPFATAVHGIKVGDAVTFTLTEGGQAVDLQVAASGPWERQAVDLQVAAGEPKTDRDLETAAMTSPRADGEEAAAPKVRADEPKIPFQRVLEATAGRRKLQRNMNRFHNANLEEQFEMLKRAEERLSAVKLARDEMDGTALCSLVNKLAGFLHAPGGTIAVASGTGDASAVAGPRNAGLQQKVRKLLIDCLEFLDLSDSITYESVDAALQHIKDLMMLQKLNQNQPADDPSSSLNRQRSLAIDQWQTLAALVGTNQDDSFRPAPADAVPGTAAKREAMMLGKDRASAKSGSYQPNIKVRNLKSVREDVNDVVTLKCSECHQTMMSTWFWRHPKNETVHVLVPENGHGPCRQKVGRKCMEHRIALLEEEVEILRAEVSSLRRELARHTEGSAAQSFSAVTSVSLGSYSAASASGEVTSALDSPVVAGGSPPVNAGSIQSWSVREAICDEIALWLTRSLNGEHRSTSGRERLNLPSRVWLVARDYEGRVFNPPRLFRRSAKACGSSGLMDLDRMDGGEPSPDLPRLCSTHSGEADINFIPCRFTTSLGVTVQAVPITEFESKLLVAFPAQVWHRTPASRVLPRDMLSKPILVEVLVAQTEDRSLPTEDGSVCKVWLGLVKPSHLPGFSVDEEDMAFDYSFKDLEGAVVLPIAQGLADAANDHFAFLSVPEPEIPDGMPADAGLESRMQHVELFMGTVSEKLDQLAQMVAKPQRPSALKQPAVKDPHPLRVSYPDLDPTMVASARAAGVEEEALAQMQKMMSATKVSQRLTEPAIQKRPGFSMAAQNAAASSSRLPLPLQQEEAEEPGWAEEPSSPSFQDALSKLTQIVGFLTDEKVKKAKQTGVEAALENVGSTGSAESAMTGGTKRAAAARRALRTALLERPHEISSLLERLMWEDLTSRTQTPGMPREAFSARAWVEHRSKISSHKTSAFSAWAAAGILDDLVSGDTASARARAALLLLQLDQVSIDRGSWTLGAELSLEPAPPFSSLQQHLPPSIQDGEAPFSRLLDARWAEVALAHLSDTDTYLTKRKTVGKKVAEEKEPSQPGPKPKFKAKAKAKKQEKEEVQRAAKAALAAAQAQGIEALSGEFAMPAFSCVGIK